MATSGLNQLYDEIKAGYDRSNIVSVKPSTPNRVAYRAQTANESEKLKSGCMNQLLLDIYLNILPFDAGYADGHRGMCRADLDAYLADKKLKDAEYFQSAYKETKAPLLEYLIRAVESVGQQYLSDIMEKRDEAEEAGVDVPSPTISDKEVEEQIVDIKHDGEYEHFIDELKKKTIKKIVDDVSQIISEERDIKNMTFKPTTESTESAFTIAFEYIVEQFLRAGVELPENMDDLIGMAIRESVLNTLDNVFRQPGYELEKFRRKIRMGNGLVVNKESVERYIESME